MIYLYIYLGVWFLTTFEPLQDAIDYLFKKLKPNYFVNALWQILGCQYCSSLWFTLILTGSITMSLILAIIAQFHKHLLK